VTYDYRVDRVLRRIREVLVIVTLCLLIAGMVWFYAAAGSAFARLGDAATPDPVPTECFGEEPC
jgi:hypothetical protein